MTRRHSFALLCFEDPGVQAQAHVTIQASQLVLCWDFPSLLVPEASAIAPSRPGLDLWKGNAVEAFFRRKNETYYEEFNWNLKGNWDRLVFSNYRTALSGEFKWPCPQQTKLEFTQLSTLVARFTVALPLSDLSPWANALRFGESISLNMCAIFRTGSQALHFALKHEASKPDFHQTNLWKDL